MERGGGRSADERAAAAEERLRAREAREQGAPIEDEEPPEEQESGRGGWRRPELGSMSRYGGGIDVYTRRRVVAGLVVIALIVAAFLALGGC